MQACGHYSLFITIKEKSTWQIYGATAIKSGHVIAWKVIMTVEAAGQRKWVLMRNKSSLPGLNLSPLLDASNHLLLRVYSTNTQTI